MKEHDLPLMVKAVFTIRDNVTSKYFRLLEASVRLGNYRIFTPEGSSNIIGYVIWAETSNSVKLYNSFTELQISYIGELCSGDSKQLIDLVYFPRWRACCLNNLRNDPLLQCLYPQYIKKTCKKRKKLVGMIL